LKTLKKITAIFIVLLFYVSAIYSQSVLTIGDDAPALKYSKWIKGTPVEKFEKGKIYVLEFWATWCGPCKAAIPHLTELAHQYKDKVVIIGIDAMENAETIGDKIKIMEDFVKTQGDKMDYCVAYDSEDGYMDINWMKAAMQPGIPSTFVVGKDSKIAWIGHPKDLEKVLIEIIDDKYDLQAHKEEERINQEKELQKKTEFNKFMMVTKNYYAAVSVKDYAKVISEYEAIVLKEPSYSTRLDYQYFQALLQVKPEKLLSIANEERNNNDRLYFILNVFAQKGLDNKYYEYAISLIEPILTKEPIDLNFLALLENIYEKSGKNGKAIEVSEKILSISKTEKKYDAYTEKFEKKLLELKK